MTEQVDEVSVILQPHTQLTDYYITHTVISRRNYLCFLCIHSIYAIGSDQWAPSLERGPVYLVGLLGAKTEH